MALRPELRAARRGAAPPPRRRRRRSRRRPRCARRAAPPARSARRRGPCRAGATGRASGRAAPGRGRRRPRPGATPRRARMRPTISGRPVAWAIAWPSRSSSGVGPEPAPAGDRGLDVEEGGRFEHAPVGATVVRAELPRRRIHPNDPTGLLVLSVERITDKVLRLRLFADDEQPHRVVRVVQKRVADAGAGREADAVARLQRI